MPKVPPAMPRPNGGTPKPTSAGGNTGSIQRVRTSTIMTTDPSERVSNPQLTDPSTRVSGIFAPKR